MNAESKAYRTQHGEIRYWVAHSGPSLPWLVVKWSADGNALTQAGRDNMREMMLAYGKREYCALVGHSYRIAAQAIESRQSR